MTAQPETTINSLKHKFGIASLCMINTGSWNPFVSQITIYQKTINSDKQF